MAITNYVVPERGFGVPRRLSVNGVAPQTFLTILGENKETCFPVVLYGNSAAGFRVHRDDILLGSLSAADSQDYPEFDWILEAGLSPQVTAHVRMQEDAAGDAIPTFELVLPAPGLCVPMNNPPTERWAMMESGPGVTVTDFLVDETRLPSSAEHILVRLDAKRLWGRRTVNVFVDNTLVASLPKDAARQLTKSVRHLKQDGLTPIARAYYCLDEGAPSLTIYASETSTHRGAIAGAAGAATATSLGVSALAAARARAHAAEATAQAAQATSFLSAPAASVATTAGTTTVGTAGTMGTAGTAGVAAQTVSAAVGAKLSVAAGVAVVLGGSATIAASTFSEEESGQHSIAPADESMDAEGSSAEHSAESESASSSAAESSSSSLEESEESRERTRESSTEREQSGEGTSTVIATSATEPQPLTSTSATAGLPSSTVPSAELPSSALPPVPGLDPSGEPSAPSTSHSHHREEETTTERTEQAGSTSTSESTTRTEQTSTPASETPFTKEETSVLLPPEWTTIRPETSTPEETPTPSRTEHTTPGTIVIKG
ncbi:hypothetical protein [Corynebacterium sp.]|uniref:hypothetical protein n=1 Tax=Corynebacterium sp. TaxID=1720 RepID=UPI0026DC09BA|nr:hypothetical protein [Corynebacterium sp.]MDO5031831.1 hypothetical protein [Corynebacterium sp.]